jgi:hypothetical protein
LGPDDKWRLLSSGTLRHFKTTEVCFRYYHRSTRLRAFYTGQIEDVARENRTAIQNDPVQMPNVSSGDSRLLSGSNESSQPEVQLEAVVESILCHFGSGKSRRYRVLWAEGDETEEPESNLMDVVDGEEVLNEKLMLYCSTYDC